MASSSRSVLRPRKEWTGLYRATKEETDIELSGYLPTRVPLSLSSLAVLTHLTRSIIVHPSTAAGGEGPLRSAHLTQLIIARRRAPQPRHSIHCLFSTISSRAGQLFVYTGFPPQIIDSQRVNSSISHYTIRALIFLTKHKMQVIISLKKIYIYI